MTVYFPMNETAAHFEVIGQFWRTVHFHHFIFMLGRLESQNAVDKNFWKNENFEELHNFWFSAIMIY